MFSNLIIRFIVKQQLRGNRYKLCLNCSNKLVFNNCFKNRIVSIWNHVPDSCFNGDTLVYFKNQLQNIDFSRFLYGN